jgi:hypothetical protein
MYFLAAACIISMIMMLMMMMMMLVVGWDEDFAREVYLGQLGLISDPRATAVRERTNGARTASGVSEMMGGLLWANCGYQQFHLPVADDLEKVVGGAATQTIRGNVTLLYTAAGMDRLRSSSNIVGGSSSAMLLLATMAGNRIVARPTTAGYIGPFEKKTPPPPLTDDATDGGGGCLGMEAVSFDVRPGVSEGICRFYSTVVGATTTHVDETCRVLIGARQRLEFREGAVVDASYDFLEGYDGHHVAVYTNDFERIHRSLMDRQLLYNNPRFPQFTCKTLEEAQRHNEFRFVDIVDPLTNEILHRLEHEIRSVQHPSFAFRHLVGSSDAACLQEEGGGSPEDPESSCSSSKKHN